MAQTALPAPRTPVRRRALGGLVDADGWTWAGIKALFWFVLIILLLGYLPDRAYYFTVQRTVDVGLLAWSPVNFCPPENETLPCPAPGGATLPWHPAPAELRLPAARTDGTAAAMGSTYVYAGGTDGTAPSADVYISKAVPTGNMSAWVAGPALPEPRTDAASVAIGSTMYVIGGYGPDGKPTDTVYSLTIGNDGALPAEWTVQDKAPLPEGRAGAAAVAVSDGIVVVGGTNGTAPAPTVWKIRIDNTGTLGAWAPQSPLYEAVMDSVALHVGDVIFVIGGRNAKGEVVSTVQQGLVGGKTAPKDDPNAILASWRASVQTNLPGPRTNMSGFSANGGLYVQGGSDGVTPRTETLWATPDADGVIAAWNHLAQTDLGQGLEGSASIVAASHAFLVAGRTPEGVTADPARTNLAPQPPFFQIGILGAVVPALKLDGEVGQQLGYLNAATLGVINFAGLLLVGYGFNHKEKVRALVARIRRRR